MTVLIVDDEAIVILSCQRILAEGGVNVVTAGNALEALRILSQPSDIRLMVTDIKMPRKDGFQLIAEARRLRPGMAVLVMTGYLTDETIENGRRIGADAFIAKPFTPEELLSAVERAMGRKAAGGPDFPPFEIDGRRMEP